MNFWKNLHPLLRRDKTNEYGSVNSAVLQSLADSLSDAEADTIAKQAQLSFETTTGDYLDEWGSWFGVTRRQEESDDDYRERIKYFFLIPRSTVEGIIKGVQYYLDDANAKISIYEPWKNIFYLNNSKLNGDDHLQGFYYRYAVIDVSIDRPMSKTIYDAIMAFKPAGVKFYVTFNPNINSKVHKLTVAELKARKLFTVEKAYGFMYDHKLPVTFSDRPATLVNNTNYLKLNDSKLNGEDVLAGSPTHNVTYWNPLKLSYSSYKDVPVNLIVQSNFKTGYLDPNTGGVKYSSMDFYSDNYIATNGATVFTFSSPDYMFKGSSRHTLAMYDSDKNYLGRQPLASATQTLSKSNVAYIRFSINSMDEGNTTGNVSDWLANHRYKLEKGSVATPWSPNPADPEYYASTPTNRAILSSPSNTYVPLPHSDVPVNLINGSYNSSWSFFNNTATIEKVTMDSGEVALHVIGTSSSSGFYILYNFPSGNYTASIDVKGTGTVNRLGWENISASGVTPTSDWQRVSRTASLDGKRHAFAFYGTMDVYVRFLKVEEGATASPWSPNPADPGYSAPTMITGTLSVYNQFIANYGSLLNTYSGNTEYDRVRSLVNDPNTTVFLVVNADVPLTINGVLHPAGVSSTPVDKGSLNYTGSDISIPVSVTGTQDARVYYVYAKVKVSKDIPGLGVNIKASQNVSIIKHGPVVGNAVVGTAVLGQETITGNTK